MIEHCFDILDEALIDPNYPRKTLSKMLRSLKAESELHPTLKAQYSTLVNDYLKAYRRKYCSHQRCDK